MLNFVVGFYLFLFLTNFCCNLIVTAQQGNYTRFNDLKSRYGLQNAKKQGAVQDAVHFMITMEDSSKSSNLIQNSNNSINRQHGKCEKSKSCPICNVTISSIINDGTFIFTGNETAPYSQYCWSMRIRYHVAPLCEEMEKLRGVQPAWSWKWTLKAAVEGYCLMPSDSPADVALSYRVTQDQIRDNYAYERNPTRHQMKGTYADFSKTPSSQRSGNRHTTVKPLKTLSTNMTSLSTDLLAQTPRRDSSRPVIVLMLGLSFMGQPFMSMGCKWSHTVVGGGVSGDGKDSYSIPVDVVRANGGQCTGYKRENIADFYSNASHKAEIRLPRQNVDSCNVDHAMIKFGAKGPLTADGRTLPGKREMWICYVYTFNIPKNVKMGSRLPCNITSWLDVDVVLSIPNHDNLLMYLSRTCGVKNFSSPEFAHVKVVNIMPIYEGLLYRQLQESADYKKYGSPFPFQRGDYQAKFGRCSENVTDLDIHYRLPGVPDWAASVWLSLIATGLGREEDRVYEKRAGLVGFWQGDEKI